MVYRSLSAVPCPLLPQAFSLQPCGSAASPLDGVPWPLILMYCYWERYRLPES